MFLLLFALGILAGWLAARVGALLPKRAHGARHPILVWRLALPLWVVLAGVTAATAPGAGYLWTLPLLVAGIGLLAVPATNPPAAHPAPARLHSRAASAPTAVFCVDRKASNPIPAERKMQRHDS